MQYKCNNEFCEQRIELIKETYKIGLAALMSTYRHQIKEINHEIMIILEQQQISYHNLFEELKNEIRKMKIDNEKLLGQYQELHAFLGSLQDPKQLMPNETRLQH